MNRIDRVVRRARVATASDTFDCDIGIAGGNGVGILFKKGKIVKKFPEEKLAEVLLAEVEKYENEWKSRT